MISIFKKLKSIAAYWELVTILATNQIKIAYKHTVIGVIWAVIVPLFTVLILKIVFSLIIKVQTQPYPYFIFTLTGILPFSYFRTCVSSSSMSLLNNASLLKRVYFPREIIPISIVFSDLFFFIINLCIISFFIIFYGFRFNFLLFLLPLVIFIQLLFIIGISLIVSSLQVIYRDVKYIVEIVIFAWFYLTPVFYPLELVSRVSKSFLWFYMLNPMAQIVSLYRTILLPGYQDDIALGINVGYSLFYSLITSVVVCIVGFFVFMKNEDKVIDLL